MSLVKSVVDYYFYDNQFESGNVWDLDVDSVFDLISRLEK